MPESPRSLEHQEADRKSDDALRREAREHLAANPPLQLVAELLIRLRSLDLPWWKPEDLRAKWGASERMRWLRGRPDLRQKITSSLTGLVPRAARRKAPDFQGALIDSAIDEGDVSARAFEESFDPCDLAVYGPSDEIWRAFVERFPWSEDSPVLQELWAWTFEALLADQSSIEGLSRKPILSAWDARTSIDGRVWHAKMPLEIRVAIDDARFQKERDRAGEPFHAASDLSIAVAATIAASIPMRDLHAVLATAERAMGFSRGPRPGPGAGEPKKPDPAKKPDGRADAPRAAEPSNGAGPVSGASIRSSVAPPPIAAGSSGSSASSGSLRSTPPPAMSPQGATSHAVVTRSTPPPAMSSQGVASQPASSHAVVTRSTPPPALASFGGAPPVSKPAASAQASSKPSARAESTLPSRSFHEFAGDDLERTNPWDIPAEEPSVDDPTKIEALASGDNVSTKRRRSGKG